jgi:phenylalanine-4-hydroxylase
MIVSNEILAKLPKHLLQFVKPQDYEAYTPIDQAVWRYVMRKNVRYLSNFAHASYLTGLEKTGISFDYVPSMYGMNRILKEIGWAAVAVDGLIPTEAFLEFQAYNVLVIAADIRQIEDIEYTPSPDIIHESAGHAPIIANVEYAEFLRRIGAIGCRAIASSHDHALYAATRQLTNLKDSGNATPKQIMEAENALQDLQKQVVEPSEMAKIRNLHWWSVEYGLIGDLKNPKIYGAGLLSSIGESAWCMSDKVEKLPYTTSAADCNFDYTKPQPQLFVTPNFAHLSLILDEFANTMALRKGGLEGVNKLIESKHLGTIELSTGLQISGIFTEVIRDAAHKVAYIQTSGKTALAFHEKELLGHGTATHAQGFGSPIGKLKGINLAIEDMSPRDLEAYNIYEGRTVNLHFEGDINVSGEVITGKRNLKGKILLISFRNCTVKHKETILFHPDWGIYDMAIGKKVVSAFAGAADANSFELSSSVSPALVKPVKSQAQMDLENLYEAVNNVKTDHSKLHLLPQLFNELRTRHPNDWLLALEIIQLLKINNVHVSLQNDIEIYLNTIKQKMPKISHLIQDGLALII